MEGSSQQKRFRTPFKFSLSSSSLKPSPNPAKSEQSAASILRPRKLLSNDNAKNRWSFSPISSSQLPNDQAGSESKLQSLSHYETSTGVKYSAHPIIGRSHQENGILHQEEERGRRIYDRPRSQVYPTSPLTPSPQDSLYDTPKITNQVPDPSLTTPPSSKGEVAKYGSQPSSSSQEGKDLNQNYPPKVTEVKGEQETKLSLSRSLGPSDIGSRSSGPVEDKTVGVTSPVRPPRRNSSTSSAGRKPLSTVPPVTEVPDKAETKEPKRKRRLTRRISLEPKKLDDDEFIGFATLPDQVHRKAVKRGFEFCMMVVGETGLGKSTLINSLFLTDLYKDRKLPHHILDNAEQTTDIEKKQLDIEEKGVKVRLSVVDTPGFSEAMNGDESWKPIVDYVDRQFEQYYQAESGVNRKNIQDSRVHCCLYFVSPYGHGLKPIDIFMMKKLHHKVNIIPLIAKCDTLTPKEKARLKTKILDQIDENEIKIYQFPECDSDEDDEFKQQDKALKAAIPFAVVGSNTVVEVAGKRVRGRMYQWGIVEVENPDHCDFVKLRQMLISTHMQDLKEVTSDVHYENYRKQHITQQRDRSTKERMKLKRESAVNLGQLEDTDFLIAQKDAEIQRMQEMLAKMQAQLQTDPRAAVNGT
ncbi:septin-2 isoform X2 [Ostrea edulis]|nr:septin-2 isoform X2 [Ostrea edulis]